MKSIQNYTKNPFSPLKVYINHRDIFIKRKHPNSIDTQEKTKVNTEKKKKLKNPEEEFLEVKKSARESEIVEELKNIYPLNLPKKESTTTGEKINLFGVKDNKRLFNRHSGTGRGKEISKNGSGSKTCWGNQNNLSRSETQEILEFAKNDEYNSNDKKSDSLSLKTKEVKDDNLKNEDVLIRKSENFEEPEGLENKSIHHLSSKKKEKQNKKIGIVITPERFLTELERPKNAVTYNEYIEKNKLYNQKFIISNVVKNNSEHVDSQLKINEKRVEDSEFQNSYPKKLKKKKKEKKVDEVEENINKLLNKSLKLQ